MSPNFLSYLVFSLRSVGLSLVIALALPAFAARQGLPEDPLHEMAADPVSSSFHSSLFADAPSNPEDEPVILDDEEVNLLKQSGALDIPPSYVDGFSLRARFALLIDAATGQVLYEKSADAIAPVASISKLMTAYVIMSESFNLNTRLRVERADLVGGSKVRLRVGTVLSRRDFLKYALMASDNSAAHLLGRTAPGGMSAFVAKMNQYAQALGMSNTRFVEPTGLRNENQSTPRDLVKLLQAAMQYPEISAFSTLPDQRLKVGKRLVSYRSSNGLVRSRQWEIDIQKTGFIRAAGRCLVMQFRLDDRPFIAVLLGAPGRNDRIYDAVAIRHWLESSYLPQQPKAYPVFPAQRPAL